MNREWSDDTGSLRRFGLALARDDRFVLDDASATRLVDKLIRQSAVAPIAEEFPSRLKGRARAFARLIQLYRRHVRRLAMEDVEGGWTEGSGARSGPAVVNGVRALPLELREALLLVVLGGFSHGEATEALDIPMSCLLERLERGRMRLAQHMGVSFDPVRETNWQGAPHLRVIK
jgi:hypothetical protein